MPLWLAILSGLVLIFGSVVFVGAPYLPSLSPQVKTALELLQLKKGDTVLELGCGDGRVLIAAAAKGYRAVGIELNPILAAVAWLRTLRYGRRVTVIWGNFWRYTWPPSDGVYVFLIEKFMPLLDRRMTEYGGPLVSIAFTVPGKEPTVAKNGVLRYDYGAAHKAHLHS